MGVRPGFLSLRSAAGIAWTALWFLLGLRWSLLAEIRLPAARFGVIPAESHIETAGYWESFCDSVSECRIDRSGSLRGAVWLVLMQVVV